MLLRDVMEEDLPTLFEHQRDPEVARIAALPPRDHDAFFEHWRTNVIAKPNVTKKTIVVDGEIAGSIVGFNVDERRMIGYRLAREYWGRGIATAALGELLSDWETSRPVYAFVAVENTASRRVLEKCGFVVTGPAVTGSDGVAELLMRLA